MALIDKINDRLVKKDYFNYVFIPSRKIGFVTVTYEMFDTNGKFVKDNSPFEATFVLTCANQHNTYLPSAIGFENGGYEVEQCHFAPGTGEIIADLYVEMLTSLHNK